MSQFIDLFSERAARYAAHRPRYPAALAKWLAGVAPGRDLVWDCGTGNGQAAEELSRHFSYVVATDASVAQLRFAVAGQTMGRAAMTAEMAALRSDSAALITVAQALHWFDLSRFYTEAKRVLVSNGVLAVWTYGLVSIEPSIDAEMIRFYKGVLGEFWPAERAMVDSGYQTIEFPFTEIAVPAFTMDAWWRLEELRAYLDTWSAVTLYERARGESPVGQFIAAIADQWGPADTPRHVTWPLRLRVGRA